VTKVSRQQDVRIPPTAADVESVAAALMARSDREVAAFLAARPDLVSPPSPSFTALAARAVGRSSVEAALTQCDAPALAVAQCLVRDALTGPGESAQGGGLEAGASQDGGPEPGASQGGGPGAAAPAAGADGSGRDAGTDAVVPDAGARTGADGAAGPGEGAQGDGHEAGAPQDGGPGVGADRLVRRLAGELDADVVTERLAFLERLALTVAGHPVTGLVEAAGDGDLLPADVSLRAPQAAGLDVLDAATVSAEACRHAEEVVRLVSVLLEEWGRQGAPILRTGGVGVRGLNRSAEALHVSPTQAATVIELTAGAGLLGLDRDGSAWIPSREDPAWSGDPLPERWAALVVAWAGSDRAPWLVGRRGPDNTLRAVLHPETAAPWVSALRHRLLRLLLSLPEGTALTADFAYATLSTSRPRRRPEPAAVEALLAQAELLGLTGSGALSAGGRVLARALAGQVEDEEELLGSLARALAADLPTPVGVLLVQSDLTAVVPGRPTPELADLLERCTRVESRGGALTVRFTAESVRAALDAGELPDRLLERLARFSPGPLPSTLTSLVHDAARHHGAVRVRAVVSVLRAPDPAVTAGLLADRRLSDLGLSELAPGVLAASAPVGQVLRELRAAGLAPVPEDADGELVLGQQVEAHGPRPEPERLEAVPVRRRRPAARDLMVLVGRMRKGEEAWRAAGGGAHTATDPVHALAVMRQARATRTPVLLRLAGTDGAVQERRVRVLEVEPGRVRLADLRRQTELTVGVHRIVSVTPAS